MNILILGKKGEAIQQDLQRNLDDSWTIYNWNPGESEVDLSNLLDKADIAITGSDALIYGGIFKFISFPYPPFNNNKKDYDCKY